MALSSQGQCITIQAQPYRPSQQLIIPHVSKEDTPKACVFTTNLSGYKVEDVQVQVEDDQALVLRCGRAARRFELPPNACPEQIKANWNQGVLTITIPKKSMAFN